MSRKKMAVEIVSQIGSLGHDLQFYPDSDIAAAVKFLRTVNPDMFDWLSRLLADANPNPKK